MEHTLSRYRGQGMELDFPRETLDQTTKVNALHLWSKILLFCSLIRVFAKYSFEKQLPPSDSDAKSSDEEIVKLKLAYM